MNNEKSFPALLIDINGTTGVGEEARVIDYCAMCYNVLEQEVETCATAFKLIVAKVTFLMTRHSWQGKDEE